jgi:hypothetical protein
VSSIEHIRKNIRGLISCRAGIMCLAALSLLWARNIPPTIGFTSSCAAFQSLADHDHRPCFDHEDPQWPAAMSAALATPWLTVSSRSSHPVETPVGFVTDGWHYNRPPPIG